MPALVVGVHAFVPRSVKDVNGRDKPGHNGCDAGGRLYRSRLIALIAP
ncbi:hypothetical protein [Microvirga alba]|uniref:Uncharacterized protein n=1 Tax=Microvirga alba TaxID=2791025 RepID=A0A931FN54_9HYPH|nr:hypothetical protein [Microvirga alba]MBF9233704.1 hypothetical protein [Microvirga alba]